MKSLTDQLLDFAFETRWEAVPAKAIAAAKTFILDSYGVGVSGSRVSEQSALQHALAQIEQGNHATVWSTGERLSCASAAMLNAWQIHNQEFDCIHEKAVVHPMAVILAVLTTVAEKEKQISGKQFILAVIIAVEFAGLIGMSAIKPMRFFRPAMCGALGATAGIAKLLNFNREQLHNALGLCYCHLSGTMQAHSEGLPTLAYQIGLNARAAVTCAYLASENLVGPKNFLEGEYGYFNVIEGEHETSHFSQLGQVWQITQLSHKPFPSGRASHGAIDGLMQLMSEHPFQAHEIKSLTIEVPPLVSRLVDRPYRSDMRDSYAKLCISYLMATILENEALTLDDFGAEFYARAERIAMAEKVSMHISMANVPK